MKKWETPKVVEEQLAADSHVSACYSLVCTLPGDNPYIEDGWSTNLNGNWITPTKVKNRAQHNAIWGKQTFRDIEKHDQNCALPARYNADTNVFKESGGNAAEVSNIEIDTSNMGLNGKYPAIWTSKFGFTYHHMGYAVDDSVGHPNRS